MSLPKILSLLEPFLCADVVELCHQYAHHSLWGVLPTVANLVRSAQALAVFPKSVKAIQHHEFSHVGGVRNLAVRSPLGPVTVYVSVGGCAFLTITLAPSEHWAPLEQFVGCNLLYISLANFHGVHFYATQPVDLKYEDVMVYYRDPWTDPFSFQNVWQVMDRHHWSDPSRAFVHVFQEIYGESTLLRHNAGLIHCIDHPVDEEIKALASVTPKDCPPTVRTNVERMMEHHRHGPPPPEFDSWEKACEYVIFGRPRSAKSNAVSV